ncbi:MAG: hypothetical protein NTW73_01885 [Candidatus Parcubacteria bacterium]|nr:hypothetical protein [Candidatus Parcubacteria bacterium]
MKDINLANREFEVLEAVIRQYLKTGEPVGSKILEKKSVPLSSSMIRHYFFDLTQQGFLEQPHTSSGRLPTDKAWHVFLEKILLNENIFDEIENRFFAEIENLTIARRRFSLKKITDWLSERSKTFSFCYWDQTDDLSKSGLKYLLEPEGEWEKIAKGIEEIDEKIKNLKIQSNDQKVFVFIGQDNPFFETADISVMIAPFDQDDGLIGLAGPKRMLCEDNITLLHTARNLIK